MRTSTRLDLRPLLMGATICLAGIHASAGFAHELTLADRVAAQAAIERIYYGHQIGAVRPFEAAVPESGIERKVATYLRQSLVLERNWKSPITHEALERELERIASHTHFPERLTEIYHALGDDPVGILECFARPVLADRLARSFLASDPSIQASARREAQTLRADLASGRADRAALDPRRATLTLVKGASDARSAVPDDQGAASLELSALAYARARALAPAEPGEIGPVVETREAFEIRIVLEEDSGHARIAVYRVPKMTWDAWWAGVEAGLDPGGLLAANGDPSALPAPRLLHDGRQSLLPDAAAGKAAAVIGQGDGAAASGFLTDNTWDNGSLDDAPRSQSGHLAVWTGTLMIVWGGFGTVDPWHGFGLIATGSRYDPLTDTWQPLSTTDYPWPREGASAVWTGSVMIVWGGKTLIVPTARGAVSPLVGGSGITYDPASDSWSPLPGDGYSDRYDHVAIWTGPPRNEMIVWGGKNQGNVDLGDGGRYSMATHAWTPIAPTGAPSPRSVASAVWSGSRMYVWGGKSGAVPLNSGAAYNPVSNTWTTLPAAEAPSARFAHTAVWSGLHMVIWGGFDGTGYLNTGASFDPASGAWIPTAMTGAPDPRAYHTAIRQGSNVIVWGGENGTVQLATGAFFFPLLNAWSPITTIGAPHARSRHTAVFTGSLMVVWGGRAGSSGESTVNTGGRYDPLTNSWTPTSTGGGPSARWGHAAVWTGTQMIVWGGNDTLTSFNSGGRYDPLIDAWTPTSTTNAPEGRSGAGAVWTGYGMIVWGGRSGSTPLATGGRYDPVADAWSPTTLAAAPAPRANHSTVWTGRQMIVWGGLAGSTYLGTGGRYDPAADAWSPTTMSAAPVARASHTAVWTGCRMIVWGGGSPGLLNSGAEYDPVRDRWRATTLAGAPTPRYEHTAVWTGERMLVWAGVDTTDPPGPYLVAGGLYDPVTDTWTQTPIDPSDGRGGHTAVWTGSRLIAWGGYPRPVIPYALPQVTNVRFDPVGNLYTVVSEIHEPTGRSRHTAVWTGTSMIVWGGLDGLALNDGGSYATVLNSDGEGGDDAHDNCPLVANPTQTDVDGDGTGDACDHDNDNDCVDDLLDCAPYNGGVFSSPGEVGGARFAEDGETLAWTSLALDAGSATQYDVARGALHQFPVGGGASEICLASGLALPTTTDTASPSQGTGAWYLIRARNVCGAGTWGAASTGTPEVPSSPCP